MMATIIPLNIKGINKVFKALIGLIAALSLCGCITTRVKTELIDPKGQIWLLTSKSDACVELKQPDGTILKVDNRGKATFFETYMQYLLIKAAPSVELSNQPGTQQ